jgi:hypothetical protein
VNDPTSLSAPVPNYTQELDGVLGARDLKIGIDWGYVSDGVDPELVEAIGTALEVFGSIGAEIVPFTAPSVEKVAPMQRLIMETECANFHRERYTADPSGFGKLRETIERGLNYDPVKLSAAYIEKDRFRGELVRAFQSVDVIAAPIMPWVGVRYDELDKLFEMLPYFGRFSGPYNMAGVPDDHLPDRRQRHRIAARNATDRAASQRSGAAEGCTRLPAGDRMAPQAPTQFHITTLAERLFHGARGYPLPAADDRRGGHCGARDLAGRGHRGDPVADRGARPDV